MSDSAHLHVNEIEIAVPKSKTLTPVNRWHFNSSEFAYRLIVGHGLNHGILGDLKQEVQRASEEINFESCGGDSVVENFNMDELDELALEGFAPKETVKLTSKTTEIFDAGRYRLMEGLVHSEAVTHVIELEQRMRNQRRIIVKNRFISIQKMIERHRKELQEKSSMDPIPDSTKSRHLDDRERIESHFRDEIKSLEQKQRVEFIFNADRLIKESARGVLKPKELSEGDWVEVTENDVPPNQESFTVNLGNQLKLTQNLRLVQCDIIEEIKPKKTSKTARLECLFNLFAGRPAGVVIPVMNSSMRYIDEQFDEVRRCCIDNTDFVFPSIDEQLMLAAEQVETFPKDSPVVTRHSNLSASAHVVFYLYVGKLHTEKSIESRHPTFIALRLAIKEAYKAELASLMIPLLLTNTMHETMTAPWCLRRAEIVMKCIKGYLIEFPLSTCTVHFTVPMGIDGIVFKRIRDLIPENFRLTVALNI